MKVGIAIYGAHQLVPEEGRTVAKIIRKAAEAGYDGIDLGYFWGQNRRQEMIEAQRVADDSGIELANYICGNNFGNAIADNRLNEEIDKVRQALDEAAFFGCPVLRIFAGGIGLSWKEYAPKIADAMSVCVEYANANNVVMAVEDHGCLCKDSVQQKFYINTVNSPYLRTNADIGNYYFHAGERPEHGVAAVADVTAMVHVKDFAVLNNTLVSVPVGEGVIDHRRCFRILRDAGYEGYLTLEYECDIGDPRQGISTSLVNMRRFLAEC